jgi:hypothetical protein
MYTTCMFCNRDLGRNEVVETFPVGVRLAFDGGKGRLWVVCPRCERWNLTPLDERWEAVETCERLFRGTRLRASTENVGLARHASGLELIRIGPALRPEFAAWRYGDQFGRRRRRAMLYGAGAVVALGGLAIGGMATGVVSGTLVSQFGNFASIWQNARTRARVRTPAGEVIKLKTPDLLKTRLVEVDDEQGWGIEVRKGKREEEFRGEDARRTAALILPAVNSAGGTAKVVRQAVEGIEAAGHPEAFIVEAARFRRKGYAGDPPGSVQKLPRPTRLALEMALHEEQEMRALQGELWRLERAWKDAEEIAAIADGLLVPEGTQAFLDRHRDA